MKNKLSYSLLLLYSPLIFSANQAPWHIGLGIGSTLSSKTSPANTLNFEQGLFDMPYKVHQSDKPSLRLSAKKRVKATANFDILIGGSLYYLQHSQSGQVWGMGLPQFYNFNYQQKDNHFSGLLETNLQLNKGKLPLTPSIFAGIGLSQQRVHYDEKAIGFYPPSDEIHSVSNSTHVSFDIGADLHWQFSQKCSLSLSYVALVNGSLNQLLFLQMNYQLGDIT